MPPERTCRGLCHIGAVVARHDYLPFGEEIPADTAGRSSKSAVWGERRRGAEVHGADPR